MTIEKGKKKLRKRKHKVANVNDNVGSTERSNDELSVEGTSFVTLIDGINHVDVRFENKKHTTDQYQ